MTSVSRDPASAPGRGPQDNRGRVRLLFFDDFDFAEDGDFFHLALSGVDDADDAEDGYAETNEAEDPASSYDGAVIATTKAARPYGADAVAKSGAGYDGLDDPGYYAVS